MARSTTKPGTYHRDEAVGMGGWFKKLTGISSSNLIGAAVGLPIALPVVATAGAVAAPVVAATTALSPVLVTGAVARAAGIETPDEIKNLGEKFNIGDSADDWKKWAKAFVDVSTVGLSRSKSVRDAVKDLGEQWNVGNNSVDTLKSMANVASIVGALSGVGALASAMLGSSTLTQGAMTAAREYARQSLRDKIIGKAGEELADPYVDHLIRKARRDQAALQEEERALIEQYKAQRPGVYSLMMMAVENPNALTQEQIQVIVNYQRDLERERALAEKLPPPPDEDWANYYARFLAEYGVAWAPTDAPGVTLVEGGGLPPVEMSPYSAAYALAVMTPVLDVAKQPRIPQSLALSPELKAALDSLYPPSKTV